MIKKKKRRKKITKKCDFSTFWLFSDFFDLFLPLYNSYISNTFFLNFFSSSLAIPHFMRTTTLKKKNNNLWGGVGPLRWQYGFRKSGHPALDFSISHNFAQTQLIGFFDFFFEISANGCAAINSPPNFFEKKSEFILQRYNSG